MITAQGTYRRGLHSLGMATSTMSRGKETLCFAILNWATLPVKMVENGPVPWKATSQALFQVDTKSLSRSIWRWWSRKRRDWRADLALQHHLLLLPPRPEVIIQLPIQLHQISLFLWVFSFSVLFSFFSWTCKISPIIGPTWKRLFRNMNQCLTKIIPITCKWSENIGSIVLNIFY